MTFSIDVFTPGELRALADVHPPDRRTAQFTEHPCELVKYHAPTPVMTEFHHRKPVFLQNKLYGKIVYGADLWVCSNCHDAIHAWLYFMLGMWKEPTHIGRAAKAEAVNAYEWFTSEWLAKVS